MGTFIDDANKEYVEALIETVTTQPFHKLCVVTFYLTAGADFIGTSMLFTRGAMKTGKDALRVWCALMDEPVVCKDNIALLHAINTPRGIYVTYDWTDSGRLMSQGKFDHTQLIR